MTQLSIPLDPATLQTLQTIEAQRRQAVQWSITTVVLAVALLILALLAQSPYMMIGIVLVAVPGVYAGKLRAAYIDTFKRSVVSSLVQQIAPGATYEPDWGIEPQEFAATYLYTKDSDRYATSDLVSGQLGATAFRFAQVHAQERVTTRTAKGHRRTSYRTIFDGMVFVGDFHKHFQSHTLLYPDVAEATFGRFGQKLQALGAPFQGAELVKLEDPEFERLFVVYSTNQVEARYLLSPGMLQRLTTFRQNLGQSVPIAFCNGQIYAALSNVRLAEIPFWTSVLDPKVLEPMITNLRFALSLIDVFNLNTRIWSKA